MINNQLALVQVQSVVNGLLEDIVDTDYDDPYEELTIRLMEIRFTDNKYCRKPIQKTLKYLIGHLNKQEAYQEGQLDGQDYMDILEKANSQELISSKTIIEYFG